MTGDLWALAAAMLLAVVQLTLSSVLTLRQLGGAWVAGPRDEPREVIGLSGRFVRAHRNLLEIFPQFVAALFLVHAADAVGSLSTIGAWVFVVARILYVAAYAFAPPGVRPICWLAAQVGIFTIVADIFV
ncbi:MAPEG family protein [Bradyrhizobium sp. LB11.1]|uniref:MAPEG family protein n=1 Tax=Bradyrhizobium sp. LB11.1 TaxID=3156326 RepID=UPI003391CA9D